jgi:PIN domain nuclease of toxin-antitoxin system
MKLLLDTHILLWAAVDNMPEKIRNYIVNGQNMLLFSPASIWEITIKQSLGRPDFKIDSTMFHRALLDNGYHELSITCPHVLAIRDLPPLHKDPFDRILLAQAKAEGLSLLTADMIVAKYPGPVIFVGK